MCAVPLGAVCDDAAAVFESDVGKERQKDGRYLRRADLGGGTTTDRGVPGSDQGTRCREVGFGSCLRLSRTKKSPPFSADAEVLVAGGGFEPPTFGL